MNLSTITQKIICQRQGPDWSNISIYLLFWHAALKEIRNVDALLGASQVFDKLKLAHASPYRKERRVLENTVSERDRGKTGMEKKTKRKGEFGAKRTERKGDLGTDERKIRVGLGTGEKD